MLRTRRHHPNLPHLVPHLGMEIAPPLLLELPQPLAASRLLRFLLLLVLEIARQLLRVLPQQLAASRPLLLVLPQQLAASRLLLLVLPQQLAESRLLLLALLVLEIARPLLRVLPQQRSGCKPFGGGLWGLWGTERMQETKARTSMPLAGIPDTASHDSN